ncbi:DUF1657 domain-containing protein [Candidatus Clostridium stratigraminis]|uniref:DUF1657 domain-containing protein n=1 Tax=Candidatus Clostridium stratigraminis TaxID=3381661 RepID=A0ABW8T7K7_9CLOT
MEVIRMTVGVKMQQTIASAESVVSSLKTFALDTEDKAAQKLFNDMAQTQQQIIDNLKGRLDYIQSEEPQYKNS